MSHAPKLVPPAGIAIGPSPGRGRGVFATRAFAAGDVVEVAPVVAIPAKEEAAVSDTVLGRYVFGWKDGIAVALGYGSLYNHSWAPNLEYRKRVGEGLIEFVTLRDVAAGEELFTNYSVSHPDRAGLWSDLL